MLKWAAAIAGVSALALALGIHMKVGDPAAASPGAPSYVAALERHLDRSPGDARARVMLARAQFEQDRFGEAAASYERALASPRAARDAQLWCELADALAMAQGGSLKGRPRELIGRALAIDTSHPRALEMAGSAAIESGDYAAALGYWERLASRIAPAAPEHEELERALQHVRALVR